MKRHPSQIRLAVLVVPFAVVLAACGSDDASPSTSAPPLSAQAQEGKSVAQDMGCTSCHRSGDDSIAPSWEGLAGSEVELEDGTVVVADDDYLKRAIVDPNAQIVKGFNGIMPVRELDEDQVTALVAYLKELGG